MYVHHYMAKLTNFPLVVLIDFCNGELDSDYRSIELLLLLYVMIVSRVYSRELLRAYDFELLRCFSVSSIEFL